MPLTALLGAAVLATGAARGDTARTLRHDLRQTWQTAEGLPQNSVRAIVQTGDGYLWFGTAEGLVRFDGVKFTVFDRNSSPALPVNNVGPLIVDSQGALWIGLRRFGLARLHAGKVTTFTRAQGLSADEVQSLAAMPDGSVWAGTAGQGLNRIREGRVTVYSREEGLPDDFVYALAPSSRGLLVGTGAGAAIVTDGGIRPLAPENEALRSSAVTALLGRDRGDGRGTWIGTSKGLWHLQGGHQRLYTTADGLPSNDVTSVTAGGDEAIWIGLRSGGLARFADGRFEPFTVADGLPDDFVHTIYEDRERNVWVGTNTGGLSRLHTTPFRTVSRRDGLPADVIRAVFESQDGAMWVATHAHGLARIHNGAVTRWTTAQGLPSDGIAMIGQSRDGTMWIGTRDGLVRMRGGVMTRMTVADGLPHANVRGLFEDRDGRLWIGTVGGVCRMQGRRCVAVAGLEVNARGFHQSADGAVWIASNRGLFRYDPASSRLTRWGAREGLSSEFLTSMAAEADGTLWLSTAGSGLNRFKDGHITAYHKAEGLYDETIYRVLADRLGWLWMTTNRGLFRVARAELEAVAHGQASRVHSFAYTEVDGLPSAEFNGGSYPAGMLTRDGQLWLPSVKGVVIVDPAHIEAEPAPPQARVERAMVDGRAIDPSAAVTVGPGNGNIELHYTAFHFTAPARIRFRYKLEGFDPDWIEAGARRTAYYTRIPPGQYAFRVQAANESGVWGAAAATAPISLRPRFYQTGWFVAAGLLGGIVLLWGAVHWRMARHRAQERRLVEMVDARTRELQDEVAERKRTEQALVEAREAALEASRLKSEFLANMSHEIRTPMNGIIGMTELALAEPLPPVVQEYLQIVDSSALALLHVLNDILDFAKIEAGKLDLVAVDFDPRTLLDSLVTLLGPQAGKKGLTLGSRIAPDVPPRLVGDPMRLRQVLTNLIGNALKFTDRGDVRVELTCVTAPDAGRPVELRFAVADTGIGIAESDRARIFEAFTQVDGSDTRRFGGTGLGLAISAQLVELMGGRLEVQSELGRGSTFSFVVRFDVAKAAPAVATLPAFAHCDRPLSVLVAEDSPVNQLLVRRLLEKAGHAVTVVETGAAAIEAAARSEFDAIFMDLQMPEMNGFDATCEIRAREADGRKRTPIIALTAHAMRGDRERCLAAGMDGYLSKPVRPDVLFASLAEVTGSKDAA